jgi:hypothetical protein
MMVLHGKFLMQFQWQLPIGKCKKSDHHLSEDLAKSGAIFLVLTGSKYSS